MVTLFTSESVTEGHPDKICDQISDSILDAFLTQDPESRVACEVLVSTGLVVISGEIRSKADFVDVQKIARQRILDIGYNHGDMHFDGNSCAVLSAINEQSPDIAQGVDGPIQGAGDQGLMFGFACNETPEKMPLPITMAHKLAAKLAQVRQDGVLPYIRPDGKTQVTFSYEGKIPRKIETIVISSQHARDISQAQIRSDIIQHVIQPVCGDYIDENTKLHVNPTGTFVIGGPQGDCGLTGRKIIVDTYGGYARHGGGAFSGKDPSKVDRSAAYMARFLSKNIVSNGLAEACEVQLSYAIGVAEPVSVRIDSFGTEKESEESLSKFIRGKYDLTPKGIIDFLDLKKPIYTPTATYGHFGRENMGFPWEETVDWN